MFSIKRIILVFTALVMSVALVAPVSARAQGVGQQVEASPYARGAVAIDQLGDRLPEVARDYGLSTAGLRSLLLEDETLAIDSSDQLLYFDVLAPGEAVEATIAETTAAAPPTTGAEFQLASNPGAAKTIFLDFDGHTTQGTTWNSQNGIDTIVSPAYDTDGSPDTWSVSELSVIANSWAVVAEDFAPWDVNVTTIEPGADALRRSSSGDTEWGVRVLITTDTFLDCGCGGVAYIGAFDDDADEPAFVFNRSFVGVSEAASHEVGHTLLLAHDGTASGSTYYTGHDSTTTPGWAPIMGASYYQPVTQWSQQEYFDANNDTDSANYGNGRDDFAIISSLTNGNGFGLKSDDHGDTASTATVLSEPSSTHSGLIGTRSDRDLFTFTTSGGFASFTASPAQTGPNLDIGLTIKTSTGEPVASANPATELDASVSVELASGTYIIQLDGVGIGEPSVSPPSGYTDYASVGQYTLQASIDGLATPDTEPPAAPTGLTAAVSDSGTVELAWVANSEPDISFYEMQRSATAGGPYTAIGTSTAQSFSDTSAPEGTSFYVVVAVDDSNNVSSTSNQVSVTIESVTETVSVASGEVAVAGTIVGTFNDTHAVDGIVETITESESGGKPSKRHDRAEHRWQLPAGAGNQSLRIVGSATGGGDADTGFIVEWSNTGTTWLPLTIIAEGSPVDASFDIGSPSDTVWVRVIDTDQSPGQRNFNSVSIDLIELSGDGEIVTPTDPISMTTSITTSKASAGAGQHYGVATVTAIDDQGGAVEGASVTVTFSGDFVETGTAFTDSSGVAVITTTAKVRKPTFSACVADATFNGLTWIAYGEAC